MFTKEDNQVLDRILNARKTCRAFAENVPTDDEIKEVIQAGCIAPYASIDAKAVTPFRHFFVIKNSIDFSVSFYNYHEPSIYPCL